MRRVKLFLLLLIVSLSSFGGLFVWNIYLRASPSYSPQARWMEDMWQWCMGGTIPEAAPAQSNSWMIPVALAGVAIVALIGAAYFLAFPEISAAKPSKNNPNHISSEDPVTSPFAAVRRTSNPEERKVLEVLVSHNGRYLQKYIRKETGLSRLKVHRILARFVERGVVSLKRSGNTNVVFLSDWLKSEE